MAESGGAATAPEPLVLLPDLCCDAGLFAPQVAALSGVRPLMVAPCLGDGIVAMADAIVPHLPPVFALAGQGLGSVVATEILRRMPDRVTRLALIAAYALAEPPPAAAAREPRIAAARAGRLAAALESEYPAACAAPGAGRPGVLAAVRAMGMAAPPERFIAQSRALQRRPDQQAVLRRLTRPALVLCGAHDTLTPVRRHEVIAGLVRRSVFTVLDDAGHFPTLEMPAAVTQALTDWLARDT